MAIIVLHYLVTKLQSIENMKNLKQTFLKTIKTALFASPLILLPLTASAQGTDYYQGSGRIAISSDGNKHDNDDMQATMLTLAILAKAELQNSTTLYTYADHIWGSERDDLHRMTIAAETTARRFGFGGTTFIAAVENPEAAYNAMRDEILKSTANDPLFIVAAGPMHVVGTAIERAYAKNPESLKNVTVISHSIWNNEHSDKPSGSRITYHSDGEEPHEGWCWDEMVESFGKFANFNLITDQNGTGEVGYKTKDKFSFKNWELISWMRDHNDPNMRWIYQTAKLNPCGPDFSDAGLVYYLCADLDGVRGDDMGNSEKLQKWMGNTIFSDTPDFNSELAGGILIADDFIKIEAEAFITTMGEWRVRRENDPLYSQIKGYPFPSGSAYVEYTGGTISGWPAVEGDADVLVYKFTPKTSGNYIFTARMAQRITADGETQKEDLCNDVLVKMEGDFESGNDTPKELLTSWQKFYGRGLDKWGALSRADVNHEKFVYSYALKAGKEYTFKVKGRSQRCNLDFLMFVKNPDYKYHDHIDIMAENPLKYRTTKIK
ncbi:MAG: hypothetical protein R3Y50_05040 [Rikenellaceae bacterium]